MFSAAVLPLSTAYVVCEAFGWEQGVNRSFRDAPIFYGVYTALIVVLTAAVLMFKFQNLERVTVSLLGASATLPVSVLVLLVYVLGMLTGGSVLALLRGWIRGARGGATRA